MSKETKTLTGKISLEQLNSFREKESRHPRLLVAHEKNLEASPMFQVEKWINEAQAAGIVHPNTFVLATTSKSGVPLACSLRLKEMDENGLVFYCKKTFRLAKNLADNKAVSAVFSWPDLNRQITVTGEVIEKSAKEAERFWKARPQESKISHLVQTGGIHPQSREHLEEAHKKLSATHGTKEIPMPHTFGVFTIQPHRVDFFDGRSNRLHDIFIYEKTKTGAWRMARADHSQH